MAATQRSRRAKTAPASITPQIAFEAIDPETAYELLANNTHNRNLRPRLVETYARDMRDGKWEMVGEPIEIAPDGKIINGQHRLMAVIEADVGSITFPVIRGVSMSVQRVVDSGAGRKFADTLKLEYGVDNASVVAAAVRFLYHARKGGVIGATGSSAAANPSRSELLNMFLEEKNIIESVSPARTVRGHDRMPISEGILTALHYLFTEIDPDETPAFYERFATGAELKDDDAILALRRAFMRPERPRTAKSQAALIIKAFNFWREGRETKVLSWRGGGSRPEPFPTIDPPNVAVVDK